MISRLKQKLNAFVTSDRETPVLAGLSVGFYMMAFYYSRNFSLANSLHQLLFFTSYFVVLPIAVNWIFSKIFSAVGWRKHIKQFLFISCCGFFIWYLYSLDTIRIQPILLIVILIAIVGLSFKLKQYKYLIVLFFVMSAFTASDFARIVWIKINASSEWRKQPDAIESVVFKEKPNIYFIQPDGYTSFSNLRDSLYGFDNSAYEEFLKANGFALYPDFRSNYHTTLLSNASTFEMKHHHADRNVDMYDARHIIVSDNAVLRTLKNNGYKTHLFTENPYLIINRPKLGFDYCNISYDEIPYLKDGFGISKDVASDFKKYTPKSTSANFYFIERFKPEHIAVREADSRGVEGEKQHYVEALKEANIWLEDIINHITAKDPKALIIIAADHGGFVGFTHTLQAHEKTTSPQLIRSMYGVHLAIRWNRADFNEYEKGISTSVNLFRTVFAFLSEDSTLLENLQENSSYIQLHSPKGLFRYIDDSGGVNRWQ